MVSQELNARLNELVASLNAIESESHKRRYPDSVPDVVRWSERTKFCAIDIGHSGAWLVEKTTGELYNITGYGRPDRNKKLKADIGNVFTVDPAVLHGKRYNYLS